MWWTNWWKKRGHAASGKNQESGQRIVEISGGKVTSTRTRYVKGFTPPTPADLPLTTFHGWLKRLDPTILNPTGRLVIDHVFPMFGEPTSEEHLARSERLAALGIALSPEDNAELELLRRLLSEGVQVRSRRHRRYSGGDGLLPRGCYSSVCENAEGDDDGTLSRELLAYVDSRIPGIVYAGDSTSAELSAVLGNPAEFRPGYCGLYVLLLAPDKPEERAAFDAIYGPALARMGDPGQSAYVTAFELRVVECTIENVIDLRLPRTREWFFKQFRNGDGHFLVKNGKNAHNFFFLLPTLLHPARGGTDETHAIGSWMRSSGVNGLVFPSARSEIIVSIEDGALRGMQHGWNFVDYGSAKNLPATEVTRSRDPWLPKLLQPGAEMSSTFDGPHAGSWWVRRMQEPYERLRYQIESGRFGRLGPQAGLMRRAADDDAEPGTTQDVGPSS